MSFTLWSRGRLLGRTALDIAAVQPAVQLGLIDPTPEGLRLLPRATAVPPAAYALSRAAKRAADRKDTSLPEYADFTRAVNERGALELELRDVNGRTVPLEWIQIMDIDAPILDDEQFDEYDADNYDTQPYDPELDAAIDADRELIDSWFGTGETMPGAGGSQREPDPRWESTKYHIMAYGVGRQPAETDRP